MCAYRRVVEVQHVVVTYATAVLMGPGCRNIVAQVVQLELQTDRGRDRLKGRETGRGGRETQEWIQIEGQTSRETERQDKRQTSR